MFTRRLNEGGATIVPEAVRDILRLREGDELVYGICDGNVMPRRSDEVGASGFNPFVAFTEWSSSSDEEAYADL